MKTSKLAAAAMALIVPSTMLMSGCSIGNFFTFFNYTYENADMYTAGDREITDKVRTINIDYVSGNVKLKGTDDDKITINETSNRDIGDEYKVHTWVDGDTLFVRYCKSINKISFHNIEKELEITIPGAQELSDMTVHVSSGNIDFSGFTTESFNAQSSSGNLKISCNASDIKIKASSGNVGLEQEGDSSSIDIKSSSGNITVVQKGNIDNVKLNASSGKIYAALDKASKLDVHVSSGGINVEANEITDLKSDASSGGNSFKLGAAPKTSDIHSSSGGVKVYIPEDSDITVKPHISSGDFNYDLPMSKNGKEYVNGNGTYEMVINVSSGDVDILKY